MKTLRKNGGFTLVELIVVIAILAILAGVAVPAYSGYIKKAKDAKVVTELSAVNTAAQAAAANAGGTVSAIVINGSGDIQVTATGATVDKIYYTEMANLLGKGTASEDKLAYGDFFGESATYANGANWSSTTGEWKAGTQ